MIFQTILGFFDTVFQQIAGIPKLVQDNYSNQSPWNTFSSNPQKISKVLSNFHRKMTNVKNFRTFY